MRKMHKEEEERGVLISLNIHLSLILRMLSPYLFYVPYWIWSFKLQMSNCWNHFWSFNPSAFLIFLLQQIFLLKENINRGKKSWKSRGEKWNTTTLTFSPPITKDCFSWVNNFCIPLFIKTLNRWSSDRTSGTDVRLAWKEWKLKTESQLSNANSFHGWSYLFIRSQRPTLQKTFSDQLQRSWLVYVTNKLTSFPYLEDYSKSADITLVFLTNISKVPKFERSTKQKQEHVPVRLRSRTSWQRCPEWQVS